MSTERQRLGDDHSAWTAWGPYLAERAWGTVREDYSENGDAWNAFPYEHSGVRAYRWNEDGLAGFSDRDQRWCFALALWNGRDSHLKERLFGLNGHQGNHGEDPKEEWWYLDATPTHSYGCFAYAYPQQAFPYEDLIAENGRRGYADREYELLDTGVFDDGWWDVQVDHAKADTNDLCLRIRVTNTGPERDSIHLVPTMWFRNRWSWGRESDPKPRLWLADDGGFEIEEAKAGRLHLSASPGATPLFCENETNHAVLDGSQPTGPWPKDGIARHIVEGADTVNPAGEGTKASLWYRFDLDPGGTAEVRVRLAPDARSLEQEFDDTFTNRRADADEFYADVLPSAMPEDRAVVARQALSSMLFSKQWYHFDVAQWLEGDPAAPAPPPSSRLTGRNTTWKHLNNADVIPMPDTWEYPWYAAWDTAFHCLPLTLLDPEFAKEQLTLLGREWYQHPNGQLPAYEWSFSDVNPPVHAWAALRVFELDGAWDTHFLERVLHKLLLNFTWWVNRRDVDGNNLFDGGFLGLDNIGPFNRSEGLGVGKLEQSDATAWMAMYSLDLLDMSLRLRSERPAYGDLATKFVEHFANISTAMHESELWHEEHGFYYDVLDVDHERIPVEVRSMVGLIPIFAARVVSANLLSQMPGFSERLEWFRNNKSELSRHMHENEAGDVLFSLVSPERLCRLLERILDEDEFLSPHGVRGLSKVHADEPYVLRVQGSEFSVGYEPAESMTGLFGGNSNWRGPVWFPLNYLLIESLRRYHFWSGGTLTVEYPIGSGEQITIGAVADLLAERLTTLFTPGDDGRRPSMPEHPLYAPGGPWHDRLLFHEYFHGDTGRGMGATHQTGWTALVASLATNSAVPFGRRRNRR
jgi:hypothetical protein